MRPAVMSITNAIEAVETFFLIIYRYILNHFDFEYSKRIFLVLKSKKHKRMKLFKTIAAAALLVLSTTIMAQGQGNRQMRSSSERAKTETENIIKAVAPTAEQALKILDINLKYAAKDSARFAEMRASGGNMDRETMMKNMQEQRAAQTAEIKAVLTDEQKAKYDAYIKERDAQRATRMGGQGGGQGGQRNN